MSPENLFNEKFIEKLGEKFSEKFSEKLGVTLSEKLIEKLRESVKVFVAIWCDISYSGESLKGEACPSIIFPNHQPGDTGYLRYRWQVIHESLQYNGTYDTVSTNERVGIIPH